MKYAALSFIFAAGIALGQDRPEPKLGRVDAANVFSMTLTEKIAFAKVNEEQQRLNEAQRQLDATVATLASEVKARIGANEIAHRGESWIKVR